MIENASGLVLRTRPLTESSLIVNWLTSDFGRLATVAKGALRPKSPFRGKLDVFYTADFSFQRSSRSELHNLREVSLLETHPALRQELGYLRQAAYCANLLEQTTETETPLPGLFDLVSGLLAHLPKLPPQPQTIFAFELKLLAELGLAPDLDTVKASGGARQLMKVLSQSEWPLIGRLRPSPAQSTELRQFLHGFLIYHLGREPKGRAAALGAGAADY